MSDQQRGRTSHAGVTLPSDVLTEFSNDGIYLRKGTWKLAKEYAEAVELHENLPAYQPRTIAAVCLYLASEATEDSRSAPIVAEVADVTANTVRDRKGPIAQILDSLDGVESDFSDHYTEDTQSTGVLASIRRVFQ